MRRNDTPGKAWRKSSGDAERWFPVAPVHDLEGLTDRQLATCRRLYERGASVLVLCEALQACADAQRPAPRWLSDAAIGILAKAGPQPRRQDVIDMVRESVVRDARDHGLTWERAYVFASEILLGTPAAGTHHVMEKSYKNVRRRTKETPGRYYIARGMARIFKQYDPPPGRYSEVIARYFGKAKPTSIDEE